jgi:hypothetical protein
METVTPWTTLLLRVFRRLFSSSTCRVVKPWVRESATVLRRAP